MMKYLLLLLALPVQLIAQAADYELLCRGLVPGGSTPVGVPANGYSVNFEKVAVANADGTIKTMMAPRSVRVFQQFIGVGTPAGAKGERLRNGECGLASGFIPGFPTSSTSGTPVFEFKNFDTMSIYSAKGPSGHSVFGTVPLPVCSSGITLVKATSADNRAFFVPNTPGSITCL